MITGSVNWRNNSVLDQLKNYTANFFQSKISWHVGYNRKLEFDFKSLFLNRWVCDTLLGRQNLDYSCTMKVIKGSPNCVLFCFMGLKLPNVENHWFGLVLVNTYLTKKSMKLFNFSFFILKRYVIRLIKLQQRNPFSRFHLNHIPNK